MREEPLVVIAPPPSPLQESSAFGLGGREELELDSLKHEDS